MKKYLICLFVLFCVSSVSAVMLRCEEIKLDDMASLVWYSGDNWVVKIDMTDKGDYDSDIGKHKKFSLFFCNNSYKYFYERLSEAKTNCIYWTEITKTSEFYDMHQAEYKSDYKVWDDYFYSDFYHHYMGTFLCDTIARPATEYERNVSSGEWTTAFAENAIVFIFSFRFSYSPWLGASRDLLIIEEARLRDWDRRVFEIAYFSGDGSVYGDEIDHIIKNLSPAQIQAKIKKSIAAQKKQKQNNQFKD